MGSSASCFSNTPETDDNCVEKKSRKRKYCEAGNIGRVTKDQTKRQYRKKRRFKGNQHTKKADTPKKPKSPASVKKIKHIRKPSSKCMLQGYRLMDINIMESLICALACPRCKKGSTLRLHEDHGKRRGLATYLQIYCDSDSCDFIYDTYSSKRVATPGKGAKPYDINYRSVYAARSIGSGYSGLEKLCGFLNMPQPMTVKNFDDISKVLGDCAESVSEKSMAEAAKKLMKSDSTLNDTSVSVDGCWQKRGYVSLNGTVAAISMQSGKVLDIEVMSRYCKSCDKKKAKSTDVEFVKWYANHEATCNLNHDGSAPMMEVVGAKRIFGRSIEKRSLRYMQYFGDGDSKAFLSVKDIYEPDTISKMECVGHYQKRVGTRVRAAKKETKGVKGLPDWMIDKLQNYFGIALRANTGTSAKQMGDAIWASFLHVASSDARNLHSLCDKSPTSWCQYQLDRINGTNLYKPGVGLSDEIITFIKPIYKSLINPVELEKCLHGLTQNHNESFNALIWERAPKQVYVGLDKMKFAVHDAVACFNDGRKGSLEILRHAGLSPGFYTTQFCSLLNCRRLKRSLKRWEPEVKKKRKIIRNSKKKKNNKNKKKEGGSCYKKGGY